MQHPTPHAKKPRRRGWIVFALLGALAIVAIWVYREATAVPEFYAQALQRPVVAAEPKEAADELEREVLTVQNQLQRAEPWRMVLKEEELNAWILTQLAEKLPGALPKEVEDPRIIIRDDMIYFACKHQQALGGVLAVALSPSLTDQPNQLAVRLESLTLGRLPLPQRQYLDEISKAAARANLPLAWRDESGVAVAHIQVPERFEELPKRTIRVESLKLRDGELEIQGTAERTES